MNQRTRSLLLDCLIAIVVSIILAFVAPYLGSFVPGDYSGIALLPIIWLALRFGPPTAVVVGAIAGLIIGFTRQSFDNWVSVLLVDVLPMLSAGLAGMFAKYTQKTLNNRRLSSTYLNIFTGSLLASLAYTLIKFWLAPMALGVPSVMALSSLEFWISFVAVGFVIGIVLAVVARLNAKLIIPKRTKYLSRKETSSLLND